jgi:hypothetical protein
VTAPTPGCWYRALLSGLVVLGYGVTIVLLAEEFARGGPWRRVATGAILLIAVPVTAQLVRLILNYVWADR